MAVWDTLFFKPGAIVPDSGKSARMESRRVSGGRAGSLRHVPHAEEFSRRRQIRRARCTATHCRGGSRLTSPTMTRRGLGSWSVDDVVAYLKTGHSRVSAATGPMSETLSLSTSHLTDADLKAIATYLKNVPGRTKAAASDPDQAMMKSGAQIYAEECSGCHAPDGKGSPGLFPSLEKSSAVQQIDPTIAPPCGPARRAQCGHRSRRLPRLPCRRSVGS